MSSEIKMSIQMMIVGDYKLSCMCTYPKVRDEKRKNNLSGVFAVTEAGFLVKPG